MMKTANTVVMIMLALTMMLTFASAQEDAQQGTQEEEIQQINEELCNKIMSIDKIEVGGKLPGYIPYGNEKMNVYDSEDALVGNVVFEKGVMVSMGCTDVEDPTYKVYLKDDDVVDDIMGAESPIDELSDRLGKDIILEGQSFTKKVKGSFTGMMVSIASWFF